MLVVPTNTDAPIYHWPYATVGLIVLNVILFFVVPPRSTAEPEFDEDDNVVAVAPAEVTAFDRYSLALGEGKVYPIQWMTHNFLHLDLIHLAGNMLFLWSFGIVVEGKIGPIGMVLMYLGIGTLHGALTQTLLIRSGTEIHAAGASAVIFGLLSTCMIWAPRNQLTCTIILIVGFRVLVYHPELYYTTVALWYIATEVLNLALGASLHGHIMISELGHLSGALWGTIIAVALVKLRLVDCEGWDVFSLLSRRKTLAVEWEARGERLDRQNKAMKESLRNTVLAQKADADTKVRGKTFEKVYSKGSTNAGADDDDRAGKMLRKVQAALEDGDVQGALALYDRGARTLINWPSQAALQQILKVLHERGAEVESLPLMRDFERRFPDASARVRLRHAQILIRHLHRPAAALRVMDAIPAGALTPELEAARAKLAAKAQAMVDDGDLELADED